MSVARNIVLRIPSRTSAINAIDPALALWEDYTLASPSRVGPAIPFSRASGATMFNSSGQLVWAPENLVPWSEDFTQASWATGQTSKTGGQADPNGGTTACLIAPTASLGAKFVTGPSTTFASGATYTESIFVRAGGTTRMQLAFDFSRFSTSVYANFSLVGSGSVLATGAGATATITRIGDWYRVTLTGAASSDGSGVSFVIGQINSDTALRLPSFTGDPAMTFTVAFAQLHRSPNASTEYIPTTSSPVYRARTRSHVFTDGQWTNAGMLVEGQATNLVPHSAASTANWPSVSATASQLSGNYLGLFAGVSIASTGDSWNRIRSGATIPLVSGTAYTVTTWFVAGSSGRARIILRDNTNLTESRITGAIGSLASNSEALGLITNVTQEAIGTVWKVSFTVTANATITNGSVEIGPDTNTIGQNIILLAAQVETGSVATSYIPTATSSVTRSADVALLQGADFTSRYNASEGTWVIETEVSTVEASTVLYASSGTVNESQRIGILSSGIVQVLSRSNGVTDGFLSLGSHTPGLNKFAYAYALNNARASRNGGVVVLDTSVALPVGINRVQLGLGHTGVYLNRHIKSLRYYNVAKTDEFLQSVTDGEHTLTLSSDFTLETARVVGPAIPFSRASGAMQFDSSGQLVWAPENLLPWSEDFENANWLKNGATVTNNTTTSPSGASTGATFVESSLNEVHQLAASQFSFISGTSYTFILYAKHAGRFLRLLFPSAAYGVVTGANFNLVDGSVSALVDAATATIQDVGNGWFRCAITATATVTTTARPIVTAATTASGTGIYAGNGSSGVMIWGAQLYRSPTASTAYIPTTSSPVYGPRNRSHVFEGGQWVNAGLLVEAQATNLFTHSELFSDAAWTKTQSAFTAGKLIPDSTSNVHMLNRNTTGITELTSYVLAVVARPGELTKLGLREGVMSGVYASFDLVTKTVISNTASNAGVIDLGSDISLCWIRVVTLAGQTSFGTRIYALPNSYTSGVVDGVWTGNSVDGLFVMRSQLETGSQATSYIPTAAAAVTRSADVPLLAGAGFASFYNQAEGTWVVEFSAPVVTNQYALDISDGNNTNRIAVVQNNINQAIFVVTTGASVQAQMTVGNLSGGFNKVSGSYKLNSFAGSINGASVITDNSGTPPVVNRVTVGYRPLGDYLNGHVRSLKYYNMQKTNTFLQSVTQ
jgi:hypothetical protein